MFFKKLNGLKEDDFAFFRIPFESRRQAPEKVKKGIIASIVMQIIMGLVTYVAADPTMMPGYHKITLLIIQYSFTLLLTIFAILYLIPSIYQKNQHIQLLAANLLLLNFLGIFPFYGGLFALVRSVEVTEMSFFILAGVVAFSGVVLFAASLYRLRRSLEKGYYRQGSKENDYDKALQRDRQVFSKFPEVVIAGTGLVFIINYLISTMGADAEVIIITILLFSLFYMGMIAFARAIISIYCKKRFTSFNFDEEDELYPLGSGDKITDKKVDSPELSQ